ncbi:isoleucine--tRNA ligase [Candidatus Peregrinibacteria bacterium]|nr:MAG: isoleucine--tRNA ligase [Candidatus Peregrinibacteria bacterium]
MGRWVDMENDYKTMDASFMESIWWVFKSLHDKGMVYEGKKAMHICPRCETPLSNFEVTLGYQDVKDNSVTWKFEIEREEVSASGGSRLPEYLLAWTTTPWSTPGTTGLSVGPEFEYVKVKVNDEVLIFAKERMEFVMKDIEDYEVLETMKGSKLVGLKYKPIMESYAELEDVKNNPNAYHTFAGDYVEVTEGTGIVTINGAYGEIDMEAANKNKLPILMDVNMDGHYNDIAAPYAGKYVKEVENKLIEDMQAKGLVWRTEKYKHSYPHCWRCDSPLLNYATSAWFVRVTDIKDRMLKNNQTIHWVPDHVKDGRFGKWLENARDWAISRARFWGTPIPIWRNVEDPSDLLVIGSIDELTELSGTKVDDLHKHIVDDIKIEKDGKTYQRIEDVFDCWFESGSMPYAQLHYPFENKEKFERNFPANFIAEGLDQTRGWFYTLHVLANALFDKPAFQNIIVNGIVLAENGQKMSKRLKNYPDPHDVLNRYGADALRFYMLNSQAVAAGDMRFSEQGVEHVLRNMMLPIWNAYSFFVTYANIDGWEPGKLTTQKPTHQLDRWILAELNQLIAGQIEYFGAYNLQKASNAIYQFVDDLTNWYIRRSRRRFWSPTRQSRSGDGAKSEDDTDKNNAYQTLYTVLATLAQVLAPFTPFMPEEIYQNLTGAESVHLTEYPKPDARFYDETLTKQIHLAKNIVSLGLSARAKKKIKVRQPLQKVDVVLADPADHTLLADQLETIKEELNVKEVNFVDDPSTFALQIAKPNAKLLGPKYGANVQHIIAAAKRGEYETLGNGNLKVLDYELSPDELTIDYVPKGEFDVESAEGILIALDTTLTNELREEGFARDLVRQIQDLRKKADYQVCDRISVALSTNDDTQAELLQSVIENFGNYLKQETLATSIENKLENADANAEYEGVKIEVVRVN